jgi:hypothetical protein
MKLVSMIERVRIASTEPDHFDNMCDCICYMHFLNQPLNLGMFVPAIEVGGKWEVLEMPNKFEDWMMGAYFPSSKSHIKQLEQYQQAKDTVLFEGFEVEKNIYIRNGLLTTFFLRGNEIWEINRKFKTISDLIKYAPTLTAKGQELSGLNK